MVTESAQESRRLQRHYIGSNVILSLVALAGGVVHLTKGFSKSEIVKAVHNSKNSQFFGGCGK